MPPPPLHTCIVCLGSEIRADDGVGIVVGRVLQRLELPRHVRVCFLPAVGLDLADVLLDAARVVVVDAWPTGAPAGTVRRAGLAALGPGPPGGWTHELSLRQVMATVERLYPERPLPELRLVGVEPATMHGFGPPGAAVRAALPEAVAAVLREAELEPLVQPGQREARALADAL